MARCLGTIVAILLIACPVRAAEKHWAFQPLARPAVPVVNDASWPASDIDRFIIARLEAKGLKPSPVAEPHVLIRRASFDLIGLPPTPEEVQAFSKAYAAKPKAAWEALIDRLLASSHFGERWGRHWLDGAGYVDVFGGDNDAATVKLGENKWRYRDYVITSFNDDKSFDRFVTEQIAGDELTNWRTATTWTPEMREALIATGFLRNAADDTDENELNTLDIRHGVLQRTGEVLANNLLGLTLNCAKCHDHKYEPISQQDYYAFLALLQPAFNPDRWLQPKQRLLPDLPPAEKAEIDKRNADIDQRLAELAIQVGRMSKDSKGDTLELIALENQLAEARRRPKRSWGHLQAVTDAGAPTPTRLLKRGDQTTPGDEVTPGFIRVLGTSDTKVADAKKDAVTSGRRLALARWLTDHEVTAGALVMRVRVNRIWQHLFGRGIVESSDNFGVTGSKPTHPELLDWLAGAFVADGQKLKPFLKRIMLSSVYQQTSATPGRHDADPDNQLLGRMRLRRLESEAVRDSILLVSGKLDPKMGGAPVAVESQPDGSFHAKEPRRSAYLVTRRNYHPTLLNVFDQPNLTTNCTRRASSAVVLQSLTMLNDRFLLAAAEAIAGRVAAAKPGGEIDLAFAMVLGRAPTAREASICSNYLGEVTEHFLEKKAATDEVRRKAIAHLCHMLLNTSEFLYVP